MDKDEFQTELLKVLDRIAAGIEAIGDELESLRRDD